MRELEAALVSSVDVIVNVMPLQEYKSYNVARDTFLSHLGATLWGSMRHVVAPSIADGAYHYYDKISFQLYFITQDVSICFIFICLVFLLAVLFSILVIFSQKVRNIKKLPVNLKALMDGLSSLAVSFQKVMFSQHL